MATYNGAECLGEQLESLAAQSHVNWQLLTSDDGSTDNSSAILTQFAQTRNVVQLEGPGQGPALNFLSLVRRAGAHLPQNSWLAFCDQDDVWLSDRLSRGLAALQAGGMAQPALYCSRTWIVDSDLQNRHLSSPRPRPPAFLNALAQNIAAGNTILLNPAAARLLMAAAQEVEKIVMHDWWAYLLVTGAGGCIVHDDTPTLLYRQHGANEVGANTSWRAKGRRLVRVLKGDFRRWNDKNIAALQNSSHRLTPLHRAELDAFTLLRTQPALGRLRGILRLGLYRQSAAGTLALWVAACLGRL